METVTLLLLIPVMRFVSIFIARDTVMKRLFDISNLLLRSRTIGRRTNKTGQRRKPLFPQYAELLETRCLLSATLLADASADEFSHAHDEPSTIAAGDSQIIIGPHHADPGHSVTHTHFFAETGDAHHFAWQDQDLSTSDVIDIYYDFRNLGGRWGKNEITEGQIAMTELALLKWEEATNGKIKFTENPDAPADLSIIIGTGNLRVFGYRSSPGGILGLGGGTYTHNSDHTITSGVAWMDSADNWGDGGFDYFTVVAQEVGHALGLGHVDDLGGTNIMNGFYTGAVAAYSANDDAHIQAVYGDGGAPTEPPPTEPPPPDDPPIAGTTVSVLSIGYATEGGKNGNKNLLITPALEDNLGAPTSGASVSIRLTHDSGTFWTGTATTGTDGTVTFKLRNAKIGYYTTVITGITADGLTWDGTTPTNSFTKSSAATAAVTLEIDTPQTEDSSDATPVLFVTDTTAPAETDSVNDDVVTDDVVLS
ncbi:MAG: matrixin family metalloprotease, partial [Planctomycetes bacterium]|nr:matrixin family metalloprotease [Planctomycetota bacterium]